AAAEQIAKAIASAVPVREPLRLTPAQETAAGKELTKLLRNRVAYHHSGLSYAARAGVVEALAKSGQLNVVVATMGLAAGINFSMRSVIVTDRRYFAANFEHHVEADELLQMFGRAGRRGLDEVGYALYTNDLPRLSDARPCGFWVTDERARFVRRGVTEMLNSRDEWEPRPPAKTVTLGVALVRENDRWQRALTLPRMLEEIGTGNLCRLREQNHYGRE